MTTQSFNIRVTGSRGALARIVAAVYDRGADVNELTYVRGDGEPEGLINLTASGGGQNLELHLHNIVGVLEVETDRGDQPTTG